MITLLFSILCFIAVKAEEVVPLEPGIYYENIGEMKIAENKWTLVLNFDLNDINTNVDQTKLVFTKMTRYCSNLRSFGQDSCLKDIKIGRDLIIRLDNDKHRINELLGKTRMKRGLFDVIGLGFKFFFGTMDSSDAEKIGSQLLDLNENKIETDNLLKNQIQIIDDTFKMANNTLNHVMYNDEIMKENSKSIIKILKSMKEMKTIERDNNFQKLKNFFHILYDITNNDLQNLERFLIDIHSNILNTKVISFTKLLNEIKKVENNIPKEQELMLDIDNPDIEVFFKFLKLGYMYNEEKMFVIIQIPLIYRQTYKIMNLHPVPICKENNCISMEISNDIYGITETNENHVKIDKQYFEKNCKLMSKTFYCSNINILYKNIEDSCETAIIFQNKPNVKLYCKEKSFQLNSKLIVKLYNENSYLIINPIEEKVILKCKEDKNIIINLKNTMKIVINRECKLYLKTMILKFNHYNGKIESNLTLFEKIHFEFNDEIVEIMNDFNNTQNLPHVIDTSEYKKIGTKINILKHEFESKKHRNNMKNFNKINFIFTTILSTILTITLIVLIFKFYRNKNHLKPEIRYITKTETNKENIEVEFKLKEIKNNKQSNILPISKYK